MREFDIEVAPSPEIELQRRLRYVNDVFLMSAFDIEVAPSS